MRILILVLGAIAVALGIIWYKESKREKVMPGRVIVIDGASSAGKSSVIKHLMPMLDASYQCVAVDDFITEVFLEQQMLKLPQNEFIARVNKQDDLMYDTIKSLVADGKNVILDTVLSGLEGEKSVRKALDKLKDLKVVMVLVHCSLPTLIERISKRNERALQENKPEETRSLGTALSQFGSIYRPKAADDEVDLGLLSRSDVEYACEAAKKEWGENIERFNQFKAWLMAQLGVHDKLEVSLTTRLAYDYIVDTSKQSSQECAQLIKNSLA